MTSTHKNLVETLKQAEAGDAEAQYSLGMMYAYGEGVPEDSVEAVKWYRKSAEQGNEKAKEWLEKNARDKKKKPTTSRPKIRKPLILFGAVMVAITAILLFLQDNYNPILGSSDKPYLVPAPPETPMDRLDDPNADGWPTEALAEEAKQQLKGLGKLILNLSLIHI